MESNTRILKKPDATIEKQPAVKDKNILISDSAIAILNYRIQQEELSSRIYKAMSMWLNNSGYIGAAKLWAKYSDEEFTHADWAREYLLAMGVQPTTPKLDAPTQNFTGLPEIIRLSYDHEIVITKQCKQFASDAFKEGDHMLYQLALKYVKEQLEEHEKMQNWVDRLVAFGEDKLAMRFLDQEMGA